MKENFCEPKMSPRCAVKIRTASRSGVAQSVVARSTRIRSYLVGSVVGSRKSKSMISHVEAGAVICRCSESRLPSVSF